MRSTELKPIMGAVTLRLSQARLTWLIGHFRLWAISSTLEMMMELSRSPPSYIEPLALNEDLRDDVS